MSVAGWLFLLLSWGIVAGFVAYCFYMVFLKE